MEIYLVAWSFPQGISQQLLDANLRSESHALLDLQPTIKTALNSLAPVERLPPETLSYCFLLLRTEEVGRLRDEDDYLSDSTGIEWLIAITHVCRRWRTVALDAKALWRQLDVRSGPQWSKAMLSRAGSLPLVINCHSLDIEDCVAWIQDDVIPNMDRVEEIHLSCRLSPSEWDYRNGLVELCAHAAPMLKSFHFALELDDRPFTDIHFPEPLFGGAAPSLSQITLAGVMYFYSPPCSSFHNLTSLFLSAAVETDFTGHKFRDEDIWWGPSVEQAHVNFDDLLDALEQSPSLQYLTVILCLGSDRDVEPDRNVARVVRLPHMKNIILCDEASECARLMRHIYLPPTSLRSISAAVEEDMLNDEALLEDLVRTLMLHDSMQGRMRVVSIELEHDFVPWRYPGEPTLSGTHAYLKHWLHPPPNIPYDDWEIQLPADIPDMKITLIGASGMEDELHSIMNAFTRGMDFSAVETFSAYFHVSPWYFDPSTLSVDWWLDNLGQMRQLSRIALSERLGNIFIEVLSRRGTGEDIYHPKLSHVALSQVDFDERLFGEQTAYNTLYSTLNARSSSGRPLQWLLLEDCTISKRWVQELSKVVDGVLWDDDWGSLEDEDEGDASDSDSEDEDEYDDHDVRRHFRRGGMVIDGVWAEPSGLGDSLGDEVGDEETN